MGNNIKIYPMDYLIESELSDEDLMYLLDKKNLTYSLIVGMFKFAKINKQDSEIINLIQNDSKWMYKYHWSKKELNEFENKITKVLKKIYYYSDLTSRKMAQWYIIVYGLSVKGSKIDL